MQETGTLARASRRVGRTLSAVSLQLKRLEAQCGRPLFRKAGRRLELNAEGEQVLAAGRRMLALNDQLLESLRADEAGTPAEARRAPGCRRAVAPAGARPLHPGASARPARGAGGAKPWSLRQLVASGGLDLAVDLRSRARAAASGGIELPVHWLATPGFRWQVATPLAAGSLRAAVHLPPHRARGAGSGPRFLADGLHQPEPLWTLGRGLRRARGRRCAPSWRTPPGCAGSAIAGYRRSSALAFRVGGRREGPRAAAEDLRAVLVDRSGRAATGHSEHARVLRPGAESPQPSAAR